MCCQAAENISFNIHVITQGRYVWESWEDNSGIPLLFCICANVTGASLSSFSCLGEGKRKNGFMIES